MLELFLCLRLELLESALRQDSELKSFQINLMLELFLCLRLELLESALGQ
jgi:hypothetical protein